MCTASLQPPVSYDTAIIVYGLFGVISLVRSDYLIVITARKRVARMLETDIYVARDFKVFPLDPSVSASALAHGAGLHRPNEAFLLGLIKGHLYSGPFYFTYGRYDITTRLQMQDLDDRRPMWERVSFAMRCSWLSIDSLQRVASNPSSN